ncbi:MAG: D-isomer specific 2-hydroxyacid dehydrogenase NAD-binding [Anaerocolumna sp.]|nr:D-isomer specific 2-hydroxyacid dehydrogenase NAD-binding [Anaerocolumna sp.]
MGQIILIPQDVNESGKKFLIEKGYELRVLQDSSVENICKHVGDCNGILARTAPYPEEIFRAASNLKVIARHGVGYDNIDLVAAAKHGVQVCNTPLANANSVAEHTIMLLLACAKNLVYQDSELRQGNYDVRNQKPGRDVSGRTLGIIGFGRIGREVAKKAALGLDMKILVYGHNRNLEDSLDYVTIVDSLKDLITQADYISLHVPLDDETRNLIHSQNIALMKRDCVLINVARGGIVNEADLYEALKNKVIAGAGLDVFEEEPFTERLSKLFELDNVIVSPHSAALTKEAMDRMSLQAAISIDEVLKGEKPSWPVNEII